MISLKNKFISQIKSRRLNVLFLFILISLFFSLLTKLTRTCTQTISFNVQEINLPEEEVLVKDSTHKVELTITAKGFKFLKYYLKQPVLNVDFSNISRQKENYVWTERQELSNIKNQFDPSEMIENISPDSLLFKYDVNTIKKVPVKIESNTSFALGYDLIGTLKSNPDSIKVIGPKSIIDTISNIKTRVLKLNDINSNINIQSKLILPKTENELSFSSDKVLVTGEIEKFTEGSVNVPITIVNVPEGVKLNYFPKEVQIVFYTSLSNYKKISSSDFDIKCDYSLVSTESSILIPTITRQPKNVKRIKLGVNQVEYILVN